MLLFILLSSYCSLHPRPHPSFFFFFLLIPPPPSSTLFPYTTLFRSPPSTLKARVAPASPETGWLPPDANETATNADRKSTRLNSSHLGISYAVFCLKKKKKKKEDNQE